MLIPTHLILRTDTHMDTHNVAVHSLVVLKDTIVSKRLDHSSEKDQSCPLQGPDEPFG